MPPLPPPKKKAVAPADPFAAALDVPFGTAPAAPASPAQAPVAGTGDPFSQALDVPFGPPPVAPAPTAAPPAATPEDPSFLDKAIYSVTRGVVEGIPDAFAKGAEFFSTAGKQIDDALGIPNSGRTLPALAAPRLRELAKRGDAFAPALPADDITTWQQVRANPTPDNIKNFVATTGAEGGASMLPSLATGGAGWLAGLGARGSMLLAGLSSYGQQVGDVAEEVRKQNPTMAPLGQSLLAAGVTIPIAAIDALGASRVAEPVFAPIKEAALRGAATILGRAAKKVGVNAFDEGKEETLQEFLQYVGARMPDPATVDAGELLDRLAQSFVGGAIVGGPTAGVSSVVGDVRSAVAARKANIPGAAAATPTATTAPAPIAPQPISRQGTAAPGATPTPAAAPAPPATPAFAPEDLPQSPADMAVLEELLLSPDLEPAERAQLSALRQAAGAVAEVPTGPLLVDPTQAQLTTDPLLQSLESVSVPPLDESIGTEAIIAETRARGEQAPEPEPLPDAATPLPDASTLQFRFREVGDETLQRRRESAAADAEAMPQNGTLQRNLAEIDAEMQRRADQPGTAGVDPARTVAPETVIDPNEISGAGERPAGAAPIEITPEGNPGPRLAEPAKRFLVPKRTEDGGVTYVYEDATPAEPIDLEAASIAAENAGDFEAADQLTAALTQAKPATSEETAEAGVTELGAPGYQYTAPGAGSSAHVFQYFDEQGEKAGELRVIPTENGGGMLGVQVREDQRRKGIATQLYKMAEEAGLDIEAMSTANAEMQTPDGQAFAAGRASKRAIGDDESPEGMIRRVIQQRLEARMAPAPSPQVVMETLTEHGVRLPADGGTLREEAGHWFAEQERANNALEQRNQPVELQVSPRAKVLAEYRNLARDFGTDAAEQGLGWAVTEEAQAALYDSPDLQSIATGAILQLARDPRNQLARDLLAKEGDVSDSWLVNAFKGLTLWEKRPNGTLVEFTKATNGLRIERPVVVDGAMFVEVADASMESLVPLMREAMGLDGPEVDPSFWQLSSIPSELLGAPETGTPELLDDETAQAGPVVVEEPIPVDNVAEPRPDQLTILGPVADVVLGDEDYSDPAGGPTNADVDGGQDVGGSGRDLRTGPEGQAGGAGAVGVGEGGGPEADVADNLDARGDVGEAQPAAEGVRGPGGDAADPALRGPGASDRGAGDAADHDDAGAQSRQDGAPSLTPEQRDAVASAPTTDTTAPKEAKPEQWVGDNFYIDTDDTIGEDEGGKITLARQNIEAIRVLLKIQGEANRPATREEQEILARYRGWGGAKQATGWATSEPWYSIGKELASLVSKEQLASIAASTKNAHYTSHAVIRGVWDLLGHMGLSAAHPSGTIRVLEPSAGVGRFISSMPAALRDRVRASLVELDSITGSIARLLLPRSAVTIGKFEQARFANGYFDVAISNVPFGNYVVNDATYPERLRRQIHDYFFAKGLDKVRVGGVVAFITSKGTLDKADPTIREYLAQRADFLGAIRLPYNAFKKTAETDVTTDIIFLRKRGSMQDGAQPWTKTGTYTNSGGETFTISQHFLDRPEFMLGGELLSKRGLNAATDYGLDAPAGYDIAAAIAGVREGLPAGSILPRVGAVVEAIPEPKPGEKEGGFVLEGDTVKQRVDGELVELPELARLRTSAAKPGKSKPVLAAQSALAGTLDRLTRLVKLRDMEAESRRAQMAGVGDEVLMPLIDRMNAAYREFTKAYGPINKEVHTETPRKKKKAVQVEPTQAGQDGAPDAEEELQESSVSVERPNMDVFERDPDAERVAALEEYDHERYAAGDGTTGFGPSDALRGRILGTAHAPQINGNAADALTVALEQVGRVDIATIAALAGRPEADVRQELLESGAIFEDPASGNLEEAMRYLSGNVRRKLADALAAEKDEPEKFTRNVTALREALPPWLPVEAIGLRLGQAWHTEDIVRGFMNRVGLSRYTLFRDAEHGVWRTRDGQSSPVADETYGVKEDGGYVVLNAFKVFKAALANSRPTIYTGEGDEKRVDVILTERAGEMVESMHDAFRQFVLGLDARGRGLVETAFNETQNVHAEPIIKVREDPEQLGFAADMLPGTSLLFRGKPFKLRIHQMRAIKRITAFGNTMLAHVVGAGKTMTMAGAIMEQRRLGLIRRALVVVPNHMIYQFSREFREMYPNAKLLIGDGQDYAANQQRFFARAASQDFDAVIMRQQDYDDISVSPERSARRISALVDEVREAMQAQRREDKDSKGSKATIGAMETVLENLSAKLEKLTSISDEDRAKMFTFEEMGVDQVVVDEAQRYKGFSPVGEMKGMFGGMSSRALLHEFKTDYLNEINPGRGVVEATGTPIYNNPAELWVHLRYLMPQTLREMGKYSALAWTRDHVIVDERFEIAPEGTKLIKKQRPREWMNIGPLARLVRQVFDVQLDPVELGLTRPKLAFGAPRVNKVKLTALQRDALRWIRNRARAARGRSGKPKPGDDILLSVMGGAKAVSLDLRLINPMIPAKKAGNKLPAVAERIVEHYTKHSAHLGTQLVFMEQGVPGGKSEYSTYDGLRQELVDRGIPRAEIAFIHDAKNNLEKYRLFQKVNAGKIRVLVGNTEKMGAGTNVQRRLVALHHVEGQWRPADIEQRDGRILRQGNDLYDQGLIDAVNIEQYAGIGTIDAFVWGVVARKADVIHKILTADGSEDVIRDNTADDATMTAEELMAASSEDGRAIERANLALEVRQLRNKKDTHDARVRAAAKGLLDLPEQIEAGRRHAASSEADRLAAEGMAFSGPEFEMKLALAPDPGSPREIYTERKKAGEALLKLARVLEQKSGATRRKQMVAVGSFGPFSIELHDDPGSAFSEFVVVNNGRYYGSLAAGTTPEGLMTALVYRITNLEAVAQTQRRGIEALEAQQQAMETQRSKQFDTAELITKQQRLRQLEAELGSSEELNKPERVRFPWYRLAYPDQIVGGAPEWDGTVGRRGLGSVIAEAEELPEAERAMVEASEAQERAKVAETEKPASYSNIVAYHGLMRFSDFAQFDRKAGYNAKIGKFSGFDAIGSWFSASPTLNGARMYGQRVIKAQVSLKNPLVLDYTKEQRNDLLEQSWKERAGGVMGQVNGEAVVNKYRESLRRDGYDGLVIKGFNGDGFAQDVYITLEPEQSRILDNGLGFMENPDATDDVGERTPRELENLRNFLKAERGMDDITPADAARLDKYLLTIETRIARQKGSSTGGMGFAAMSAVDPFSAAVLQIAQLVKALRKRRAQRYEILTQLPEAEQQTAYLDARRGANPDFWNRVDARIDRYQALGTGGAVRALADETTETLGRTASRLGNLRNPVPALGNQSASQPIAITGEVLRWMKSADDAATARANDHLKTVVRGLSPGEVDLMTGYFIFTDLLRAFDQGLNTDQQLVAYGLKGRGQVEEALERSLTQIAKRPHVSAAIAKRQAISKALAEELVELGHLPASVLADDRYYHRQILQYTRAADIGSSKRVAGDARVVRGGFTEGRTGSTMDFNARFVESEFEWVQQAYRMILTQQGLTRVKAVADIKGALKVQARAMNTAEFYAQLRKSLGLTGFEMVPPNADPLRAIRMKLGMATGSLYGLMDAGVFAAPALTPFADMIQDFEAHVRRGGRGVSLRTYLAKNPYSHPKWWGFVSALAKDESLPGHVEALTLYSARQERERVLSETLGTAYRVWKDLVPEGYTLWQPQPGNALFRGMTLAAEIVDQIMLADVNVSKDDLTQAVIMGGPKEEWVLPNEVAAALDDPSSGWAADDNFLTRGVGYWKVSRLFGPTHIAKYMVNNVFGDVDAAINFPGIFSGSKQAATDLWRDLIQKDGQPADRSELREWMELGVIDSGMTVGELGDVLTLPLLQDLAEPSPRAYMRWLAAPGNAVRGYLRGAGKINAWREGILRLSAARYFEQQLAAGKDVVAASNPAIIAAILRDPTQPIERRHREAAAKMSRDLMVDYNNLSAGGTWMRSRLIPFYSWLEGNAKRYYWLFKNLTKNTAATGAGAGASIAGLAAMAGVKGAAVSVAGAGAGLLAINVFYVLTTLFNTMVHGDLEDELRESRARVGRGLHVILGRQNDGDIVTVPIEGAWADMLEWFSLQDVAQDARDLSNGTKEWGDWLEDTAIAPANRVINGLNPFGKDLFEYLSKSAFFPDVRTPRQVRDRNVALAEKYDVGPLYRMVLGITGEPVPPVKPKGLLEHALVYTIDTGEAAYYATRALSYEFEAARKGGDDDRIQAGRKSNALYYSKQAAKWGYTEAAEKWYGEYRKLGGTRTGALRSIERGSPLGVIPASELRNFLNSLSPEQRQTVELARSWYRTTVATPARAATTTTTLSPLVR